MGRGKKRKRKRKRKKEAKGYVYYYKTRVDVDEYTERVYGDKISIHGKVQNIIFKGGKIHLNSMIVIGSVGFDRSCKVSGEIILLPDATFIATNFKNLQIKHARYDDSHMLIMID